MSEIKVIVGDKLAPQSKKSPLVVILDRLRSVHNVGNILRLADALNIRKVICCGYTATPPHPKLAKSAMGAEMLVETEHYTTASLAAQALKEEGYEIIGVETVSSAISYNEFKFSEKTCLIFGNEALGLQDETLTVCDRFISLPSYGYKNSINVSNCAAVVMYKYNEQKL